MDDEIKCKHDKYVATTKMIVVRMKELESWQLVLKVNIVCVVCNQPFTFRAHHGFSTNEPTVSNDELELRVPIDYPDIGNEIPSSGVLQ